MKTKFFQACISNLPAAIAIISFVLFSSIKQGGDHSTQAATGCCSGYCINQDHLRKFMLDSLHKSQFEGGVYKKTDLINKIKGITGDSVYLLNVLINCNASQGTCLAITSKHDSTVNMVASSTYKVVGATCTPCPRLSCCFKKLGIARINRGCVFDNQSSQVFVSTNK